MVSTQAERKEPPIPLATFNIALDTYRQGCQVAMRKIAMKGEGA